MNTSPMPYYVTEHFPVAPPDTFDRHLEHIWTYHRAFEPLMRLTDLLHNHHSTTKLSIAYPEQTYALTQALSATQQNLRLTFQRLPLISSYTHIGEHLRHMARYSPLRLEKNRRRDYFIPLVSILDSAIATHRILSIRLKMMDPTKDKIQSKQLCKILEKINYYLEYKRAEIV